MMKDNPKPKPAEYDLKKEIKKSKGKIGVQVGRAALALITVFGSTQALEAEQVDQRIVELQPGDGGIETVCETIADMAENNGFDAESVNCVYPGQQAHKSLSEHSPTGVPQPGDKILVTVSKNKLGQYTAEAVSPKDVEAPLDK